KCNNNVLTSFGIHNVEEEEFTTNTQITHEDRVLSTSEADSNVTVQKLGRNKFKLQSHLPITQITKGSLSIGEDEYDYDLTIEKTPDHQSFQVNVKFPKSSGSTEPADIEIIMTKEITDEFELELHRINRDDTTDSNGDVDKSTIILHITQYYENPTDPDVIQEIDDTAQKIYDYFTTPDSNNYL